MNEKEKLEALTKALPAGWLSKDALIAIIKVLLAIKDLYDLLDKRNAKVNAGPSELTWEVIGGDEDGKGVD